MSNLDSHSGFEIKATDLVLFCFRQDILKIACIFLLCGETGCRQHRVSVNFHFLILLLKHKDVLYNLHLLQYVTKQSKQLKCL